MSNSSIEFTFNWTDFNWTGICNATTAQFVNISDYLPVTQPLNNYFLEYTARYLAGWGSLQEADAIEVDGQIELLDIWGGSNLTTYNTSGGFDPTKYHRFPTCPLDTGIAMMVAVVIGFFFTLILLVSACLRKITRKRAEEPDPNGVKGLGGLYLAVVLDSFGVFMCMPYLGILGIEMRLTAFELSLLGTTYALNQTIGTIILGILADCVDRRKILTLTLGACSVSLFLTGLAIKLPTGLDEFGDRVDTNYAYVGFLIARAIAGFFASTVSIIETLVAEHSTVETRTGNIGKVMAYFGIGTLLGPIVGGFAYDFGFEVLCYSAAAVTLVNTLWACVTLDISSPKDGSKAAERKERKEHEGHLERPFCDALATLVRHPTIFLLLFATVWVTGSSAISGSVGGLFILQVYQWGPMQIGSMALVGGIIGFSAQLKFPGMWAAMCTDALAILCGFAIQAVTTLIGVTYIDPMTPWALVLPGALPGTMINAQLQSLLTSFSPPQSLGTLFGFMQSMRSFGEAIAPPIGGWLFDSDLKLPFYVSASMSLWCSVLFIPFVFKRQPARHLTTALLADGKNTMDNQVGVKLTAATQQSDALQSLAERLGARVMKLESDIAKAPTQELARILAAFPPLPAGTDASVKIAEMNKKSVALESFTQKMEVHIKSLESSVSRPFSSLAQREESACRACILKFFCCCCRCRKRYIVDVSIAEVDAFLVELKGTHAMQINQHLAEIEQLRSELNKVSILQVQDQEVRQAGHTDQGAHAMQINQQTISDLQAQLAAKTAEAQQQSMKAEAYQKSERALRQQYSGCEALNKQTISDLQAQLAAKTAEAHQHAMKAEAAQQRAQLQESTERDAFNQQTISDLQTQLAAKTAEAQQHAVKAEAYQQRTQEAEQGFRKLTNDVTDLQQRLQQHQETINVQSVQFYREKEEYSKEKEMLQAKISEMETQQAMAAVPAAPQPAEPGDLSLSARDTLSNTIMSV